MKAKALIALCLTVCLLCGSALAGGLDGLNQVLDGYWQEGGSFTLSAQVQTLIPYVDSKVEMFNKLLNHLSVQAAADAVTVDTTHMDFQQSMDAILQEIRKRVR